MKRTYPEDALHRQVAQLLDLHGWLWFHPPNGGRRWKNEAARLAGMGVKPGVPDIWILEPWQTDDEEGVGVVIELKAVRNTATPKQREWLEGLEARGFYTAVCWTIDEVLEICRLVRPMNGRDVR